MQTKDNRAPPAASKGLSNLRATGLWNERAVGHQRAQAAKGTKEYFAQIRAYRYGYETPFIPSTFHFTNLQGKDVLELGVGNGIDATEMISYGARYTGLDITKNHLELTRKNIDLKFSPNIVNSVRLIEGDVLDLALSDKFDVVYSFGVLHHIAHEEDVMKKLRTMLKEDGVFMAAFYSKWSFFNIWMTVMWFLRNRMKSPLHDFKSHICEGSDLGAPVVIKIRTKQEIKRLLEASGFKVVGYSKKGFVQNYLPCIGKLLDPDGFTLNLCARFLGWYHCFICVKKMSN